MARQHPVGDQGVDPQPVQGEPGAGGVQGVLGGRARFGDQPECRRAVLDQRLDPGQLGVAPGGGLVQPLGGHGDTGELREHRAQGAGGLAFLGQQPAQIAAQLFGQGQQGEGFAQRRQVDDEEVVAGAGPVALRGAAQGVQQGEFGAAGEFGELLAVHAVAAEQVEHAGQLVLECEEFAAEVRAGVDPDGPQAVGDPGGFGVRREAGCGVGGDQQGAGAASGAGQRGGRRDGGTAGAAEAGDQDRPHRIRPSGRTRHAS